jgi:hypothetical protein
VIKESWKRQWRDLGMAVKLQIESDNLGEAGPQPRYFVERSTAKLVTMTVLTNQYHQRRPAFRYLSSLLESWRFPSLHDFSPDTE